MSVLVDHPATLLAHHPTRLTAMVVAGDPRVRASVTRHLWTLGVRDVVEASSVAEARTRIARPRDLCVVDVNLPDGSGLSLLAELRAAGWPNSLALSACDDAYGVRAAFAAGIKCYVVTGSRVLPGPGGRPVPQHRDQAYHLPVVPPRPTGNTRALSAREIQVLRLVADGRSNKAIGEAMGLSALTVKSHLARIARKLGTGDRAGLVATAMRAGIIS